MVLAAEIALPGCAGRFSVGPEAPNACFWGGITAVAAPAEPVRQIPDTLLPCHDRCDWAIIRFEKPKSGASRCTFLSSPRWRTNVATEHPLAVRNGCSTRARPLAFTVSARTAALPAASRGSWQCAAKPRDALRSAHFLIPRYPASAQTCFSSPCRSWSEGVKSRRWQPFPPDGAPDPGDRCRHAASSRNATGFPSSASASPDRGRCSRPRSTTASK